jgi:hypothetical protein
MKVVKNNSLTDLQGMLSDEAVEEEQTAIVSNKAPGITSSGYTIRTRARKHAEDISDVEDYLE